MRQVEERNGLNLDPAGHHYCSALCCCFCQTRRCHQKLEERHQRMLIAKLLAAAVVLRLSQYCTQNPCLAAAPYCLVHQPA